MQKNNKKYNKGNAEKEKQKKGRKDMQSKKSIKREKSKKEKLKVKAHSGITLIALVITIIVLLILAGVALSALTGDSGILNNAESAKKNTNLANAKEQVELSVQGAILENVSETGEMTITYDNLKKELDNVVGNGKYEIDPKEEADSWTVTVGEYEATVSKNGSVTKALPSASGTKPWLPDGFSQVEGTNLTNGLTITNSTGLQNYVWIEVPNNIKQTITVDSTEKTISLTEATTDKEIELVLHAYASSKEDATKGNYRTNAWTDEWYDGCGMKESQYQTAYSNMLNSIKKYGGFWLAQYEAGIAYEEGNRTDSSSRITDEPTPANYAKDQYPYNYVYCSEAQKIANADSVEGKYTSSLPFGIQWDLVCKFLEVKNAKTYSEIATNSTWGNYSNVGWTSSANSKYSDNNGISFTSGTKTKGSGGYLLTTGAIATINSYVNTSGEEITLNTTANPMNIYDFAGNVWEWTLEHVTERASYPCAVRGGRYDYGSYGYPAASRTDDSTTFVHSHIGFRSALY